MILFSEEIGTSRILIRVGFEWKIHTVNVDKFALVLILWFVGHVLCLHNFYLGKIHTGKKILAVNFVAWGLWIISGILTPVIHSFAILVMIVAGIVGLFLFINWIRDLIFILKNLHNFYLGRKSRGKKFLVYNVFTLSSFFVLNFLNSDWSSLQGNLPVGVVVVVITLLGISLINWGRDLYLIINRTIKDGNGNLIL